MIGTQDRWQDDLFVVGSLRDLIPEDHVLRRVDRVLDLAWLRDVVAEFYCEDNGRPGIDPQAAERLMLAGFLLGIVHDRKLMREGQVNLAIRWFAGYRLHETLPDHSSLTRIRGRWGEATFRRLFQRTVQFCLKAGIATGEVVNVDATLIRANVSWDSLATSMSVRSSKQTLLNCLDQEHQSDSARLIRMRASRRLIGAPTYNPVTSSTRRSMIRSASCWMCW